MTIKSRWDLVPKYPEVSEYDALRIQQWQSKLKGTSVPCILETYGIKIDVSTGVDPYICYLIEEDAYEHGDISLINRYVEKGQKALVLGGGIGVIATAMAKKTEGYVDVVEANPVMEPAILRTAELNNVKLNVILGAVAPSCGDSGTITFAVSEEFWASSLSEDTYRKAYEIEVSLLNFNNLVKDHDILFIDIETAEVGLLDLKTIPDEVKLVFIEIHRPALGETQTARTMNKMFENGFKLVDMAGLTSVWTRV
jgi:FkbM family methyltransferase